MNNTYERGKILFAILGYIASIVCAIKAIYDLVRDVVNYYKQKSNRADQS